MITVLGYCTTDTESFQRDADGKLDGDSLSDNPEAGEDLSRCNGWLRLLI